ncbi:TPA: LacI family DNA-binding transcriptional regulator [Streptococcus suis]
MVSIRDIAKQAGYSISTVSRYLMFQTMQLKKLLLLSKSWTTAPIRLLEI